MLAKSNSHDEALLARLAAAGGTPPPRLAEPFGPARRGCGLAAPRSFEEGEHGRRHEPAGVQQHRVALDEIPRGRPQGTAVWLRVRHRLDGPAVAAHRRTIGVTLTLRTVMSLRLLLLTRATRNLICLACDDIKSCAAHQLLPCAHPAALPLTDACGPPAPPPAAAVIIRGLTVSVWTH